MSLVLILFALVEISFPNPPVSAAVVFRYDRESLSGRWVIDCAAPSFRYPTEEHPLFWNERLRRLETAYYGEYLGPSD